MQIFKIIVFRAKSRSLYLLRPDDTKSGVYAPLPGGNVIYFLDKRSEIPMSFSVDINRDI